MKKRSLKTKTIRKLLTLLGFGSTAFIFAACYGTVPNKYREPVYTDSVQAVIEGEEVADSVDSLRIP